MDAVTHLAPTVGIVAACDFLAVARASFYRQRPVLGPSASPVPEPATPLERTAPARSLSEDERAAVLLVLHEERFQDRAEMRKLIDVPRISFESMMRKRARTALAMFRGES